MKKKSFKSFIKDSIGNFLKETFNENFKLENLKKLAAKDVALAELCQVYYLAIGSDKHKHFEVFTNESFESIDQYEKQEGKYVIEYRLYLAKENMAKEILRKKLLFLINAGNISLYRVSKLAGTNQSNVTKFIDGDNNALSEKKLSSLLEKLKNEE